MTRGARRSFSCWASPGTRPCSSSSGDISGPPAGPQALLLVPGLVALAALLQFLLFQSLSLLAFWVENTYGIRFAMRVVMEVLAGAIIPLSFFPERLQRLFVALPFPFMIYLPMGVYLGKVPPRDVPAALLAEGAWIAILALLNRALWTRGLRRYVSMGD